MSTQPPERLDVVDVDGQLVDGGALGGALGEGPALEGAGAGVQHLVDIGASEIGGEGHIEGQVDGGINGGRRGQRRRSAVRTSQGLRGGNVGVRARHPKGGRHALPPMASLAREVGDLVHAASADGCFLRPP